MRFRNELDFCNVLLNMMIDNAGTADKSLLATCIFVLYLLYK